MTKIELPGQALEGVGSGLRYWNLGEWRGQILNVGVFRMYLVLLAEFGGKGE
jgi:hypothetical protein